MYYVALLRFLGCTADASETAASVGGDEIAYNASMGPMLMAGGPEQLAYFVRHVAEDQPLGRRHRRRGPVGGRSLPRGRGAWRRTVRSRPGWPAASACPAR